MRGYTSAEDLCEPCPAWSPPRRPPPPTAARTRCRVSSVGGWWVRCWSHRQLRIHRLLSFFFILHMHMSSSKTAMTSVHMIFCTRKNGCLPDSPPIIQTLAVKRKQKAVWVVVRSYFDTRKTNSVNNSNLNYYPPKRNVFSFKSEINKEASVHLFFYCQSTIHWNSSSRRL